MVLNYVLLGIIQGIFEWIPVSSEGITALFSSFLVKDINAIDIALFLHLGTALAAFVFFRKEWKKVLVLKDKKMFNFLLIVTFVSLIVSYPLLKFIKSVALGNGLLLITGVGLLMTSYLLKKDKMINKGSVLLVGFLQGLSVIPGLSRSGSTIFGLSLFKKDPKEILTISYMMSVPVGIIASFYMLITEPNLVTFGWIGLVTSFLVGILSLHLLLKLANKINFSKFTLFFGLICLIGSLIGFLI